MMDDLQSFPEKLNDVVSAAPTAHEIGDPTGQSYCTIPINVSAIFIPRTSPASPVLSPSKSVMIGQLAGIPEGKTDSDLDYDNSGPEL